MNRAIPKIIRSIFHQVPVFVQVIRSSVFVYQCSVPAPKLDFALWIQSPTGFVWYWPRFSRGWRHSNCVHVWLLLTPCFRYSTFFPHGKVWIARLVKCNYVWSFDLEHRPLTSWINSSILMIDFKFTDLWTTHHTLGVQFCTGEHHDGTDMVSSKPHTWLVKALITPGQNIHFQPGRFRMASSCEHLQSQNNIMLHMSFTWTHCTPAISSETSNLLHYNLLFIHFRWSVTGRL